MYHDRSDLRYESSFLDKQKRALKRSLSPDSSDDFPVTKKLKKSKQQQAHYVIEKILDFKYTLGNEYFLIKWQGWSDSANTWEPLINLDNCPKILSDYISEQEQEHFEAFEKIKDEISFDNLTSDENLVLHLDKVEDVNIMELKKKLLLKLMSIRTLPVNEESFVPTLIQDARKILQLYVVARTRSKQLIALKEWENHINQVDKSKKILVENNVDLAGPPQNFTYINQSIPGQGVVIPDEPPIGCKCETCNCRSNCCCGLQGGLFAYTANKRLRVAPGTPIYECNKACKCPPDCINRVVQAGRNFKLSIFRTSTGCGWGVRTEQKIRQGQFLCQYVGEVITNEEAEKRGREYDANGLTYLFDLDFNSTENPYTIDAAYLGNISHFINHSCDPNLGVWAVWADCLDPNLPMLALFATRDIEAGEEVCFDYLQKAGDIKNENDILISHSAIASDLTTMGNDITINGETPDIISPSKSRHDRYRTECKCAAVNCRKYLF